MRSKEFVEELVYIANNRLTFYDNTFPGNCGLIYKNGAISFDCIGLVKSVINCPDIGYKYAPEGFYAVPGTVIGDWSEIQILNNCTDVGWWSFWNMSAGEYLYMSGHGGVYVGDYGNYNVVECTGAWQGGVLMSWIDTDGTRRQYRNGPVNGRWEAHGKLSAYIDYSGYVPPVPVEDGLCAVAFDCVQNEWLPMVVSDTYAVDTIGNPGHAMGAFAVKNEGQYISYAVHEYGGGWLPAVYGFDINNFEQGFAGNYRPIDAAIIFGDGIAYQSKSRDSGEWLPVVYGSQADYGNAITGYAGNIGEIIDEMKIWRC